MEMLYKRLKTLSLFQLFLLLIDMINQRIKRVGFVKQVADKEIELDYNDKWTDEIRMYESMLEDYERKKSDSVYLIDCQNSVNFDDTTEEYFILYSSLNRDNCCNIDNENPTS
jgi:hypothetical protein